MNKKYIMLKYYIILFFRNIRTDRNSFLINIIGLSIDLACAVMIYLWVYDEINMNKFHENKKQSHFHATALVSVAETRIELVTSGL